VSEMDTTPNNQTPPLDDDVLLELANELHRLAAGLRRDIQRNAVLPGLSDLSAMRPLQSMLTKELSSRLGRNRSGDEREDGSAASRGEKPGYL
jgi:hypothetical protein